MKCKYLLVGLIFLASLQGGAQVNKDRIATFQMNWSQATPDQVITRTQSAIEAITGRPLKRMPTLIAPTSKTLPSRMVLKVPDAPELEVAFLRDYNELRIVNRELSVSVPPRAELTEEEALKLARNFFGELAKRKLIDERQFDWHKVDVASTWIGGGPVGGSEGDKKRVEYRVTLRRVINGIEVANAGVRIAVHTTGVISGLRLGGVSVLSRLDQNGIEEPLGKGQWLHPQVSLDEAASRFTRETHAYGAKPEVAWSRVMYVMPEGKSVALVQPLYVVSYSLQFPSEGGRTVVSRRKTVGYSLVNPKEPPIDLTPPMRLPQVEKIKKGGNKPATSQ